MLRLTSRFLRPEDHKVIESIQKKLQGAGLTPVTDQELIRKIQSVRRSVSIIREQEKL